jgi:general secretion pathway protein J
MNLIKAIKSKSTTNPNGFTLLEVLIAMFIFAIVLTTLYTAYTGTFRNIEETESQADLYQMARIVLERMTEDLESVYMAPRKKDSGEKEEVDQPTRFVGTMTEIEGRRLDTVRFASKAHIFFNAEEPYAGTAEIVYYVRENSEEEGGFTLYRSDKANFGQSEEEGTGGWILSDRLHAIRFTYYDEEGEAYDGWDSTDVTFKDKLPSGISILLELANRTNPESPVKFMTGVTLPMSRGEYEKAS